MPSVAKHLTRGNGVAYKVRATTYLLVKAIGKSIGASAATAP